MVDISTLKPAWIWQLDDEGPPPSLERQAKRMCCLTSMTILAESFRAVQKGDRVEEAKAQIDEVATWIQDVAYDELTPREIGLVGKSVEPWTERELIDGSWSFQAAGCICWALGLCEWKPITESFDAEDVSVQLLGTPLDEILGAASPRTRTEIELMNSVTCAWLWRCRQEDSFAGKGLFEKRAVRKHVTEFLVELGKSGLFDPPAAGDFNVNGSPYRKLEESEKNQIRSRATERLRALNWLIGQEAEYEQVTCDT